MKKAKNIPGPIILLVPHLLPPLTPHYSIDSTLLLTPHYYWLHITTDSTLGHRLHINSQTHIAPQTPPYSTLLHGLHLAPQTPPYSTLLHGLHIAPQTPHYSTPHYSTLLHGLHITPHYSTGSTLLHGLHITPRTPHYPTDSHYSTDSTLLHWLHILLVHLLTGYFHLSTTVTTNSFLPETINSYLTSKINKCTCYICYLTDQDVFREEAKIVYACAFLRWNTSSRYCYGWLTGVIDSGKKMVHWQPAITICARRVQGNINSIVYVPSSGVVEGSGWLLAIFNIDIRSYT